MVVASRLPVDRVEGQDGRTEWQRSPGGLVTALEPSSGLLGKEYVKETEAESGHHLHIRTGPGRDGEVAEGLWRISLEAVDGWSLRAGPAAGRDDRGPFARLLGTA